MERAICNWDYDVAQIEPFNLLLQVKRDRGSRGSRRRGFRWWLSRGRAPGPEFQISQLEDEHVANFSLSIDSGRRFPTGVMTFGINFSMDSPLASVALTNSPLATEVSVVVAHDCQMNKLNHSRKKNE